MASRSGVSVACHFAAIAVIPHTLLSVLKRLDPSVLLDVTLQRPVTLDTCNIFGKFLGGSTVQH